MILFPIIVLQKKSTAGKSQALTCFKPITHFNLESIAEHARRPLFTLSSGDLSTHSQSLEQNLSNFFQLANKWHAILLIDEADVFLERRRAVKHEQNKLVSSKPSYRNALVLLHLTYHIVFLCVIEYYQGILFLTTNRAGDIDEAFASRIHLTLSYDHLSRESRRDLWRAFITRMHDEGPKWMDDACLDRLSTDELNGRQIRNIVSVAHSLATSRGEERTSIIHIEEALETTQVLHSYRSEISPKHGTSADEEPGSKRRRLD